MKAYDLLLELTKEGKLELPVELADKLPRNELLRIVIMVPGGHEDRENEMWRRLASEHLFTEYNEADSIYDTI